MEQKDAVTVEGTIESIIFRNESNGYTVARARLDEDGEELVLIGVMPFLGVGESVVATGTMVSHQQYGSQLKVAEYDRYLPTDAHGIYEYLASRAVKGIGPKTARALVDAFGSDTLDVLENDPHRVAGVRGVTLKKAKEFQLVLKRQNSMRTLLEFLARYQLPLHYSAALLRDYGENAAEKIGENPYLLCYEPYNLDFRHADKVALHLGFAEGDDLRLEAAIVFVLNHNYANGHAFIPWDKLVDAALRLCRGERERLEISIDALREQGKLVAEEGKSGLNCYLAQSWLQETGVADEIWRLRTMKLKAPANLDSLISRMEKKSALEYTALQRQAVAMPFENALTLITGGPGTGKTTALRAMVELLETAGMRVSLAAPTGRAAKAMENVTGKEAKTLHRLLEVGFDDNGFMTFIRNRQNPLNTDVVIVDEASMIDISMANHLLDALKPHTRLVLVGDRDQLPPIGAGNFFGDLLACEALPHVRLTEIFRQAQNSDIIMNAHAINRGEVPPLKKNGKDFYFVTTRSPDSTLKAVTDLIRDRIPAAFGVPAGEVQVICPSRQMECGTVALNRHLQNALNPAGSGKNEVGYGDAVFRVGDRVMQIRNDYDRVWRNTKELDMGTGVYNGDIGTVTMVDRPTQTLVVLFDDREAEYAFDELSELEHAFAITTHKSQGSEYEAVVIPAFAAPARLLTRNLLYTAVTRAKKLLVIVGREEMVRTMVDGVRKSRRYTLLRQRINSHAGGREHVG